MKKTAVTLLFSLLTLISYSQFVSIDSLVKEGLRHYDNKEFDKALEHYKEALRQVPTNQKIMNEMALTYLQQSDFKNAIMYANEVLKTENDYRLESYITKGTALDLSGDTDSCIATFEAGIKELGYHAILSYNLAYNYYKRKEIDKVVAVLEKSTFITPVHASSHLLLANALILQNKRPEAILALYYFLLLEPNTERSILAFDKLNKLVYSPINQTEDKDFEILVDLESETQFTNINFMLSLLANKQLADTAKKSLTDRYIENTQSIWNILSPDTDKMNQQSIWWDVYVPFFSAMSKTNHVPAYCYFTTQLLSEDSYNWLKNNPEQFAAFTQWVNGEDTDNGE